MELKRFVLLNTGRIYDMTFDYDVKCYDTVKNGKQETFGLKKTSDNILDFLEIGDLICVKDVCFSRLVVLRTDERYVYTDGWTIEKTNIYSIYKQQSNGDYKRYEVKE